MVKITNIGNKYRILRTRAGNVLRWNPGDTVEVEDEYLLRQFESSKYFKVEDGLHAKEVGAGLKTGVRKPKSSSKAPRAKPKPKKEVKSKAKPKKGLKSKKGKAD